MKKRKELQPTESELAILQLIWANGASTVREINDFLNKEREVGYTTTLKLMQIMLEKGLVTRDDNQRTHIYSSAVNETDTQNNLLNKFVQATFRGSPMKMVLQALGNHQVSKEELDDIKALIEQIENKNNHE